MELGGNPVEIWITLAVARGMALIGLILGRALEQTRQARQKRGAGEEAKRIIREAEREVEARRKEAELDVKAKTLQARTEFEQECRGRREEIQNFEKRVDQS